MNNIRIPLCLLACSAARCWWMFKYFGHDDVSILNGGLMAWQTEQFPVESGQVNPKKPTHQYKSDPQPHLVVNAKQVLEQIDDPNVQILDARGHARFHAQVQEPRPGVRGGHIPQSINVPYAHIVEEQDHSVRVGCRRH